MEVLYVISVITLLVLFMLVKKSDKKLNGLGFFGLGIVLLLCYNVFECYILNFFKIPLTLLNLSIVNFVLDSFGIIYLIRTKEKQKYDFNLRDLIFIFLIAIIVIVVGILQYTASLNINYQTTDSAVHYTAASDFARQDSLFNKVSNELWGFEKWKIASYVNSGLIMKVFSNVIDEFQYYKIFIIFDLFILFLMGYMMYVAFIKLSKGKLSIIAFIAAVLFVLGYPLNSMLFGFSYMSMGMLIVLTLLYVVSYYTIKEINLKQICVIMFLLNFMLFHAYYQFVPYVYSALFIYICVFNYREDGHLITKKNILTLIITLIIPFVLGFIYYMAQDIYNLKFNNFIETSSNTQQGLLNSFSLDGYVYNNLYSNIILLLPLVIYVGIKERKKLDFSSILVFFTISYIVILLIKNYFGEVSEYYVTKNYYALWCMLWYINFKGLVYLYENKKIISYLIVSVYLIVIIINFIYYNGDEIKNTIKNYRFSSFSEVYIVNKVYMLYGKKVYSINELELMEYAKNNLDKSKKIEVIGTGDHLLWAYPLLNYYYYYPEMDKYWFQYKLTYKERHQEATKNADYIICIYRSGFYEKYDKELLDNKEIVFENSSGKIIKNR